jgi:hypothetical protein
MSLTYIRHGERPAFTKDINEINMWENSERYQENSLDEPLTRLGKKESYLTGVRLCDILDFETNDVCIYSSPMTRCIQTSIAIIEAIKRTTGKKLKLRIEYGLCERTSLFYLNCLSFSGTSIINNDDIDPNILINNNTIDKKLMFDYLKNEYADYIDPTYKSYVSDTDINTERPIVAVIEFVETIKRITNENNNSIVVCHNSNPYIYTHYYLTQEKYNIPKLIRLYKKLDGHKSLNFVSIFNKKNDKWTIILDPQRII